MVEWMGVFELVFVILFWIIIIGIVPVLMWFMLSYSYDVQVFRKFANGSKLVSDRAKIVKSKRSSAKRVKFLLHKNWEVSADLFNNSMMKGGLATFFPFFGIYKVFLHLGQDGQFASVKPPNSPTQFEAVPHDNLLWMANRNEEVLKDYQDKKSMWAQVLPWAGAFTMMLLLLGGWMLMEDKIGQTIELGNNVLDKSVQLARPTLPPSENLQQNEEQNDAEEMSERVKNSGGVFGDVSNAIIGD